MIQKFLLILHVHIVRRGPIWASGRDAANAFALAYILLRSVFYAKIQKILAFFYSK